MEETTEIDVVADTPESVSPTAEEEFKLFLAGKSTVYMSEVPRGEQIPFSIVREMIEDAPKKTKKRSDTGRMRFLLVGFDTEYQSLKPLYTYTEVKKKQARYEVLSYQFFAKIDDFTLSGIVVPEPNSRINFVDFISYVLAKITSAGVRITTSIVLVGHFNKADFPAFSDRDQVFRKLAAIRNSLVTQTYPVKIRISFSSDEADYTEVDVHVRDSILMAPVGRKSLAAVAELIGKQKVKLHDDPETELELKRNMKDVRDNAWSLFREYALVDAEVSALYFERLTELFRATTGSNSIPSALSNIGVKLLQNGWKKRNPPADRLSLIGRESLREEIWNDQTGNFNTIKAEPFIEEVSWYIDFATECYHGGRSEQLWFGPSGRGDWSDFDLASAYPTAMAMLTAPDWTAIRPTLDIQEIRLGSFAFACVDFSFPKDVRYPTLPVRTGRGILFPQQGRSYCSSPEIEVALNLGAKLLVKHAIVMPTKGDRIFFPFIKQSMKLRANASTELEEAFWKEVTNSCYGKTAQGLRDKRVFNLKKMTTKPIPESPITNPFYAAYITSAVRAVIGEIINSIPRSKIVFSVTTDGFLTDADGAEMKDATAGKIASIFSDVRVQLTGNPEVLARKHAVKRLLGWRTRGQATLEGEEGVGGNGIVLAKAGIKTPPYTTTRAEQNAYIVGQFFERTPGRKFLVDTLTTYREIMLFNADQVLKRTERAISMEYDFKRRPTKAWEERVDHQGKRLAHLAFSTDPWKSADEFRLARQMWEDYAHMKVKIRDSASKTGFRIVRRQRRCLKTIADFRKFAGFHDMRIAVKGKGRAYLTSDLSRLRLDLCTAFQHGEAGLEDCRERLTAQQFADLLNECGFEGEEAVTRPHVEYGLRRVFTPHTTPPTNRVLRVLRRLEQAIPSLRAEDLIPVLDGLPLLLSALELQ